jgi:choline dehydrogenase-like flavoprotein
MRHGDIGEGVSDFAPPPTPPPRFGGAANEWIVRLPWHQRGVRMVGLSPIDLDRRSWVPHSGWPISWDDLSPFYARARSLLGLSDVNDLAINFRRDTDQNLRLDEFGLTTGLERFALSRVFTEEMWNLVSQARNVDVMLDAAVGEVRGTNGRVTAVDVDDHRAARFSVTASVFVLAASGFENPRLLLGANGEAGIGNRYDNVGRYHMDHLRTVGGRLTPHDPALIDRMGEFDIRADIDDATTWRMGRLTPTPEAMQRRELPHSAAQLLPKLAQRELDSLSAISHAARSVARLERPTGVAGPQAVLPGLARVVATVARMTIGQRRIPPRTDAGWSDLGGTRGPWGSFAVEHQIEQFPDPDNRLFLDDRRDSFGRRRISLDWKWNRAEMDGLQRTQQLFVDAFDSSGLATYDPVPWTVPPDLTTPAGAFHPSGGTRMHADPRHGVVDADCQVHDWHNLFVAGSSTFPTVGYANPTLTIIALALRLGDEIGRRLAQAGPVTDR